MRNRFRLAILALLALAIAAPAFGQGGQMLYELAAGFANTQAPIAISTATTTELIAAPTGIEPGGGTAAISIMAYEIVAAGTGNIQFEYGTKVSTPCDTGATVITGAFPLVAQSRIGNGGGFGPIWTLPAGKELCAVTSAAVGMNGYVSYRVK